MTAKLKPISEAASLVKNSKKMIDYFGDWPSFHDAEILRVGLDREHCSCQLEIYFFKTSSEKDSQGNYKQTAHCRILLQLEEIELLELADFNYQNVIAGLSIERFEELIRVTLHPSYGLFGKIHCRAVVLKSVEPVPPQRKNRYPR